jgi:hypothetical protein
MAGFDAELYLRSLGERSLLGAIDDHDGFSSHLNDAATALVAIAAIEARRARAVLGDYAAAEAARDSHGDFLLARLAARERARAPVRPPAHRLVALDEELRIADGVLRLRHLTLAADRTELAAAYKALPGADHTRHTSWIRNPSGLPSGLPKPVLADDRGNASPLQFEGGGNDEEWEATLTTDHPIAADATWIELFEHRIELVDVPVEAAVRIERLEPLDAGRRHLWRRVALADRHFSHNGLGPTIEALTAAGALAPDDPEIELARRVSAVIPGAFPRFHGTGGGQVRSAPEPWPSLLRRAGRDDGPLGMIAVGAVTPEFEDHYVAIRCLDSAADGFTIDAAVSPPDVESHPGNLDLEDRSLAWWASDDRGNHYLGSWNGSDGDEDLKTGTLAFAPALDPLATRLDVLPTALERRAVISFELRWGERR